MEIIILLISIGIFIISSGYCFHINTAVLKEQKKLINHINEQNKIVAKLLDVLSETPLRIFK